MCICILFHLLGKSRKSFLKSRKGLSLNQLKRNSFSKDFINQSFSQINLYEKISLMAREYPEDGYRDS